MSEWIKHDGKGLPVNMEDKVKIRFRGPAGQPDFPIDVSKCSKMFTWGDEEKPWDIVKYYVVEKDNSMTYNVQGIGKSGARKRLVEEVVRQVESVNKDGSRWYTTLINIVKAVDQYKKETRK